MPNAAATSRVAHMGVYSTSWPMKPSWVSTPYGGVCLTPITSGTTYVLPIATAGLVAAATSGMSPAGNSLT